MIYNKNLQEGVRNNNLQKKLCERTIAKDYSEEWFVKLANKKIHKDISKIDTYQEDECKNRFAQ